MSGAKQFYAQCSRTKTTGAGRDSDTLVRTAPARAATSSAGSNLPVSYDRDEFARIQAAAKKIQSDSKALVVIGIGGSYLGARAVVELLKEPELQRSAPRSRPRTFISPATAFPPTLLTEILAMIGDRDFSVNVISKSGTTTEPAIAFRIFKAALREEVRRGGCKEPHLRHDRQGARRAEDACVP